MLEFRLVPDLLLQDADMIIKGDRIVEVGKDLNIPEGAQVIDLHGYYIFPSFIDLNSHYGISPASPQKAPARPILESSSSYKSSWNEAIHPEVEASSLFKTDRKKAQILRSAGFGVVLSHQQNGIARGTSVLADLGSQKPIILSNAATHYSFSKGNSKQAYPNSMMGSIALIRQLFTDLDWYRFHKMPVDLSLEAMKQYHRLPMFFESRDYQESIRAQKLAKESGRSFIIVGSGDSRKDIPGPKDV